MKRLFHLMILLLCVTTAHAVQQRQPVTAALLKLKGDTCFRVYRYAEALDYFTQGVKAAKEDGDTRMYAACLASIGNVYVEIGDFKRSIYYYEQSREPIMQLGDAKYKMALFVNLVSAYCEVGDAQSAKAYFNRIAELPIQDVASKQYMNLMCQGRIAQAEQKYSVARYYFEQAREQAVRSHMKSKYATGLYQTIGVMSLRMGDTTRAIQEFEQGLKISLQDNNYQQSISLYKHLSEVNEKLGNATLAEEYNQRYLALNDSVFSQEQMFIAGNKLFDYENQQTREKISDLTVRNRSLLAGIGIAALIALIVSVFYALLRRKNRNLIEAQRMLVAKNDELMALNDKRDQLLHELMTEKEEAAKREAENTHQEPVETAPVEQEAVEPKEETDAKGNEAADIPLNEDQRRHLLGDIITVMNDVNVISNPDFNLSMLTNMVGSNPKYVSWIINNEYGNNFKTLLSQCRIREACRRLTDNEHYGHLTMQAIYEELGFNNAASFINAFRKVTGMTPSRYKKLKDRA